MIWSLVILEILTMLSIDSLTHKQDNDFNYNPKRGELWKSFRSVAPKDIIDVYCENPALTEIMFITQGKTMLFTLSDKKITEVILKNNLRKINRITFQTDSKLNYSWVFWHDGMAECISKANKSDAADHALEIGSEERDKKRSELWISLKKAFPEGEIDSYAENPSLTQVAFRSGRATMRFDLKDGKSGRIEHMKGLRWINRITFCERSDGVCWYILWLDGESELSIAAEK